MNIQRYTSLDDCPKSEAVLFFRFEEEGLPRQLTDWVRKHAPTLADSPIIDDFAGAAGKTLVLPLENGAPASRLLLSGLGKRDAFTLDGLRGALASAAGELSARKITKVLIDDVAFADLPEDLDLLVTEASLGLQLAQYSYTALKTDAENMPVSIETISIVSRENLESPIKAALAIAKGTILARDLCNAPSNVATPEVLAQTARDMGEQYGFEVEILNADQTDELGMGSFAAVYQGSRDRARFIVIKHIVQDCRPVVLVGKGVTFDTGGISLKPSAKMDEMKCDMGGAAAVLGLFKTLGEAGLDRSVVGLIPATDNMPDSEAVKPGDVVTSLKGKTIEIINTDAEGRLILADALTYAERFEPQAIIDLATLTGACLVALGGKTAALYSNEDELLGALKDAAATAGEKVWPMPLWDMFMEDLKSDTADLRNVGGREGGSIIAAKFLQQFIPDDTSWAHLDIAGPAFVAAPFGTTTKGGTGFGVRTLWNYLGR